MNFESYILDYDFDIVEFLIVDIGDIVVVVGDLRKMVDRVREIFEEFKKVNLKVILIFLGGEYF